MKLLIGLVFGLMIGCSTNIAGLLRFQDRELLIHPDQPGLGYPHKETVCMERTGIGRIFGKKCDKVDKVDFYDFNDKAVRKSLIDANFRCMSSSRFDY